MPISEELKAAGSLFSKAIELCPLSDSTIRNYQQRCNSLIRYCDSQGLLLFSYDDARGYAGYLQERVCNAEIGEKYASQLRNLALAFADFNSVSPEDYHFVPHVTFISSKNMLDEKSRKYYDEFEEYLSTRYASTSSRGYLAVVAPFLHYLRNNSIEIKDITSRTIRDYLVFVSPSRPNSMDCVIFSIRVFLYFLYEQEYISWSPEMMTFRMPPSRKKVPVAYSEEEIQSLIACIPVDTPAGKRDYAIIIIALYTGLRNVDIRNLKLDNINWENDYIHIVQHKTNRELIIPLLPIVGNAIADYILNGRGECDCNNVFISHGRHNPGEPLGPGTIINRMRTYLYKSGIKTQAYDGKDFHALRKTYATNLLISGTPLESVASSLGDAGVQAAKPYLVLDDDRLRLCCQEKMPFPCRKAGLYA